MDNHESRVRTQLQNVAAKQLLSIRKQVALDALNCGYELSSYFKDLLSHGCASGMVTGLIYYCDTHTFFDSHYDEIEELRDAYEDETGSPILIKGDLKNFLAWFAYEHVAYLLANELEIEI